MMIHANSLDGVIRPHTQETYCRWTRVRRLQRNACPAVSMTSVIFGCDVGLTSALFKIELTNHASRLAELLLHLTERISIVIRFLFAFQCVQNDALLRIL
jgi:hypothetical protein